MLKSSHTEKKIHQTLYHVPSSDQQGMDPTTYCPRFFPQLLTQLSPEQEIVFCIKVPSGFFYCFNSLKHVINNAVWQDIPELNYNWEFLLFSTFQMLA